MEKLVLKIDKKVDVEKLIPLDIMSDTGAFYKKQIPTKYGVTTILMYEEYYGRIKSDLSVTVISDMRESQTTVEIISAGGKLGVMEVSFGAEKKAAKNIAEILMHEGFEVVE
jgi:hypothetical protein